MGVKLLWGPVMSGEGRKSRAGRAPTWCKSCGVRQANRKGVLCYRCFRSAGGVEVSRGLKVPEQLKQMREAQGWDVAGEEHPDAKVQAWVKLKANDFKAFMTMLDRLEREYRFASQQALPVATADEKAKVVYDASKDEGGTRVKKLISDWLDELKAKSEAKAAEVEGKL